MRLRGSGTLCYPAVSEGKMSSRSLMYAVFLFEDTAGFLGEQKISYIDNGERLGGGILERYTDLERDCLALITTTPDDADVKTFVRSIQRMFELRSYNRGISNEEEAAEELCTQIADALEEEYLLAKQGLTVPRI